MWSYFWIVFVVGLAFLLGGVVLLRSLIMAPLDWLSFYGCLLSKTITDGIRLSLKPQY